MDKLIEQINKYAKLYSSDKKAEHLYLQQLIYKQELYAYFRVLIYIGITIESCIKDYQKDLDIYGTKYIVKKYITVSRFQQLNRHFRALPPWPESNKTPKNTFTRINKLTKYIRLTYRKLYAPRTYLAVNKTIQRFIGRAPEIVNILSKLILEGFKIQVLANKSYILDFIQHAKGNKEGLVNLDLLFTKEGFLKTQAVVLDLLLQKDAKIEERLYQPGKHVVQLNNLFISVKLLTRLRGLGIRGAGTV